MESSVTSPVRSSSAPAASTSASSIVLPWEYDCSLPRAGSSSRISTGAHPYAAFASADDNLFSGVYASVTKSLKAVLIPPDTPLPSSLKDHLTLWRHTAQPCDARVADVVDAHIATSHDSVAPLSAAVHTFMMYAAACKSLTPLERRLCQSLKDDLYNDYSLLSLAAGPSPVFQTDSAGNIPCVRLIGIEFSSLDRCDPPRFLLIYSRSYHHVRTPPLTIIPLLCIKRLSCAGAHLP